MKERSKEAATVGQSKLTRRQLLAGAAGAAAAFSVPSAFAGPLKQGRRTGARPSRMTAPLRRYMAASTVLHDGRIVVTGGYGQPWRGSNAPPALSSVSIYDPGSRTWANAAPMSIPRARHAAVTLGDGRVAVIGGKGASPLSSVEIYDPATNTWSTGNPLSQPRFDHSAVADGLFIYVLGGGGDLALQGLEVHDPYHQRSSLGRGED